MILAPVAAGLLLAAAPRAATLSAPPPAGEAAPTLAIELGREVEALQRRAAGRVAGSNVVEASIAFRMMARELLTRGDSEQGSRHAIVVAGFRLADARGDFDAAVAAALEHGGETVATALDRFNAEALGSLRAAPTAQLLPTARAVLRILEPVLEAASLPAMADHWPALPPTEGAVVVEVRPASWSARLAQAAEGPSLRPELAAALRAIVPHVGEAERWPDLEPEVAMIATPLVRIPLDEQTLDAAGWLDAADRAAITERAVDAIGRIADVSTRTGALADLRHREALLRVIAAVTALAPAPATGDEAPDTPRASRSARDALAPERLWSAVAPMAAIGADADAAAHRRVVDRLSAIADLLELARQLRALEASEPNSELRSLRRRLLRDALKQDAAVARQVEALAGPSGSPSDPAYGSLLASQRRRLRTVQAVDGVDRALAEIESRSLSPGAPLAARLRTTLTALGDPARADAALERAEAFVAQWRRLRERPAEVAIRADDSFVIDRCAGRANEVLAELDRRRSAWAAAWAAGDSDDAWSSAEELLEVLALIEDAAALERTRANPRLIGRWGGWDDLAGVPGATDAMDGRIAIVVEALARGDGAALAAGLQVIEREAPLWRLRAACLHRLAPALEPLPDGLSGALGRAAGEPRTDAFMGSRADDLAALGRASRELLFAAQVGDAVQRNALEAHLRDLCEALLRDLESMESAAPDSAPIR